MLYGTRIPWVSFPLFPSFSQEFSRIFHGRTSTRVFTFSPFFPLLFLSPNIFEHGRIYRGRINDKIETIQTNLEGHRYVGYGALGNVGKEGKIREARGYRYLLLLLVSLSLSLSLSLCVFLCLSVFDHDHCRVAIVPDTQPRINKPIKIRRAGRGEERRVLLGRHEEFQLTAEIYHTLPWFPDYPEITRVPPHSFLSLFFFRDDRRRYWRWQRWGG